MTSRNNSRTQHILKLFNRTCTLVVVIFPFVVFYTNFLYILTLFLMLILRHFVKKWTKIHLPVDGKSVLITGCDTGFGHHLARRLDDHGFKVFSGVLHEHGDGANKLRSEQSDRLVIIKLDVTEDEDVQQALLHVKESCEGKLWGLVNNAGFFIPGDVELCTMSQYKRNAEVNLYGTIRMIKAFLPHIRKSKGRIINMSSIRGIYSRPGVVAYSLTKFGIEALSDALRLEMQKFGVKISIIEPGVFDGCTAISSPEQIERLRSEVAEMWENATDEVRSTYGRPYFDSMVSKQKVKGSEPWISPDPVLDAIVDGLLNVDPRARYMISGAGWPVDTRTVIARIYKFLPDVLADALLTKFYGIKGCQSDVLQRNKKE